MTLDQIKRILDDRDHERKTHAGDVLAQALKMLGESGVQRYAARFLHHLPNTCPNCYGRHKLKDCPIPLDHDPEAEKRIQGCCDRPRKTQ